MDLSDTQREYFQAVREGNRRKAFAVIDRARGSGAGVAELYLEVLQPSLREVGRLWQTNEMTVADEHLATAITQMVMARVYAEMAETMAHGPHRLIAACAETERHDVGLRMVCDLLERAGWDTTYLGPTVPAEALVKLVQERRPHAVVLSATIAPHLPQVRTAIAAIREAMGGAAPYIMVGGRAFLDDPGLARRVGADGTAPDAMKAVECLRTKFP